MHTHSHAPRIITPLAGASAAAAASTTSASGAAADAALHLQCAEALATLMDDCMAVCEAAESRLGAGSDKLTSWVVRVELCRLIATLFGSVGPAAFGSGADGLLQVHIGAGWGKGATRLEFSIFLPCCLPLLLCAHSTASLPALSVTLLTPYLLCCAVLCCAVLCRRQWMP